MLFSFAASLYFKRRRVHQSESVYSLGQCVLAQNQKAHEIDPFLSTSNHLVERIKCSSMFNRQKILLLDQSKHLTQSFWLNNRLLKTWSTISCLHMRLLCISVRAGLKSLNLASDDQLSQLSNNTQQPKILTPRDSQQSLRYWKEKHFLPWYNYYLYDL